MEKKYILWFRKLKDRKELFHCHSCLPDYRPERPRIQFRVIGNYNHDKWLCLLENHMAPFLADDHESNLAKDFDAITA